MTKYGFVESQKLKEHLLNFSYDLHWDLSLARRCRHRDGCNRQCHDFCFYSSLLFFKWFDFPLNQNICYLEPVACDSSGKGTKVTKPEILPNSNVVPDFFFLEELQKQSKELWKLEEYVAEWTERTEWVKMFDNSRGCGSEGHGRGQSVCLCTRESMHNYGEVLQWRNASRLYEALEEIRLG